MPALVFGRSQTVASFIAEVGPNGAVCWATASAAPCLSIFKPILVSVRPGAVSTPSQTPQDLRNRWWRHERFHRRALESFPAVLASIKVERQALEQSFIKRLQGLEAASQAEACAVVDQCWREADAAEDRWRSELSRRPRGVRGTPFQRSWRRLNQAAGLRL